MIENALLGSNVNRIKAHNMRAVLMRLLLAEPAYRVELAAQLALSTTTITNICDELIELGLVAEDGIEESAGPRRVGRPRAALHLIKDARCAIGVQVGVETYRIAVANLKAEIIAHHTYTFSRSTPPNDVFLGMARHIEDIIAENQLERERIVGVGVGAAGLVNYKTGVNILSPNLGWENVPVHDLLAESLNLPVMVDNNVKAMALGEGLFGSGRNVKSLVFVYGRFGVGSGIFMDNHLLRGADMGAGEIGHLILLAESGKECRCGQRGCLETLVSEGALTGAAEKLIEENPDGLLAQTMRINEGRPIERIFSAARSGDTQARQLVENAAHYLGIALANLVNLLNPELLILGGLFSQGQDLILPVARETLRKTAFAGLGKKVQLQATHFGWQAGVIGAAALALTTFFYFNPEEIE
jgi:glucokinase-like ROK family protein